MIKMVPLMLCEFYLNSKRDRDNDREREKGQREEKRRKESMEARDQYRNEVCSGDPTDWEGAREGF